VDIERGFVYFPARELTATPRSVGLTFDDVRFGPQGRLHGWFLPGRGPVTLLWFHGNAGNISHRLDWLKLFHDHLGVSIFIFDYQGYGQSSGTPSEQATQRDARRALEYLRARPDIDASRVVYYGKSLGGAVAIQLATEAPPYRLVVQSSFTSLLDLGRLHYPFLPVGLILRSRYDNIEKIGRVQVPLLIVHGDRDVVVPLQQAQRLLEAAMQPSRLEIIRGAGHNDVIPIGGRRYLDILAEFWKERAPAVRVE
jgi:hypothetical protein